VEIIIGLLDDPQFGPVIMCGLGGVLTEVLKDVSFRVLPIDRSDARQMLRELKGYGILQGYRGQPAVSEEMLVDLLLKASRLGMEHAGALESVDLNPSSSGTTSTECSTPRSSASRGGDAETGRSGDGDTQRRGDTKTAAVRPGPSTWRSFSKDRASPWSAPPPHRAKSATACSIAS